MDPKTLNRARLIQMLGRVSHFRGMPDSDRVEIVSAGRIQRFPAGSVIFAEGEPCAGLYVLFTGRVHLCKIGLQGQECIISVIRPVIMFNEVAVLDGGPNPVTATAIEDCIAWQVSSERFMALMKRYPLVGTGLLQVLAARNRKLIGHYEDLLCRPVRARAAKVLLDVSHYGERPVNRRERPNQELAARAATSPEAFSRSLKELREAGLISCTHARILILAPDDLAKMALIEPEMFKV